MNIPINIIALFIIINVKFPIKTKNIFLVQYVKFIISARLERIQKKLSYKSSFYML